MTFDYVALVVAAALIAAIGLIMDSSVSVVASMLLSPLMGPIFCIAACYLLLTTDSASGAR